MRDARGYCVAEYLFWLATYDVCHIILSPTLGTHWFLPHSTELITFVDPPWYSTLHVAITFQEPIVQCRELTGATDDIIFSTSAVDSNILESVS